MLQVETGEGSSHCSLTLSLSRVHLKSEGFVSSPAFSSLMPLTCFESLIENRLLLHAFGIPLGFCLSHGRHAQCKTGHKVYRPAWHVNKKWRLFLTALPVPTSKLALLSVWIEREYSATMVCALSVRGSSACVVYRKRFFSRQPFV